MNWLKFKTNYLVYFVTASLFIGCNRGYDDVNKSVRPAQSSIGTFFQKDSTNIKTSTVLYDFVLSNASERALIGEYQDAMFGKIKSESYFQFSIQSGIFGPNIKYDSVALVLNIQADGKKQYVYGDANVKQNFKIYRVEEDMYATFGQIVGYFNQQKFKISENILAEFSLSENDLAIANNVKSVRIPIKSDFGKEIIENYKSYLNSNIDFSSFVKGIYIKSDNNSAVWGVLGGSLRLYYHDYYGNNNIKTPYTVDVSLGQKVRNLDVDRENTPLSNLSKTTPIEGQTCYIQASSGVGTKIEFPFLEDFEKKLKVTKVVINRAELVIKPDISLETGLIYGPPSQIFAYVLDEFGNVKKTNPVSVKDSKGVEIRVKQDPLTLYDVTDNQQTAFIDFSKINFSDGVYKIPLTTYIQSMVDKKRSFKESLLITAESQSIKIADGSAFNPPVAELNSCIFYNKPNTPYNISLRIIYSTF